MPEASAVNASPLIILGRARRLSLLRLLAPTCWVPPAVLAEVQAGQEAEEVEEPLRGNDWLRKGPPEPTAPELLKAKLGAGEKAVLSFALRRPGTVVVLDDLLARSYAQRLHLPLIGSLGLVLLAKKQGLVPQARPILEELVSHGLYVSAAKIEDALGRVGE